MSHTAAKQMSETKLEPPRFENGKPLLIAGLRKSYTPAAMRAIPTQWQAFAPYIGKIPGQVGRAAYGICWQAGDSANIEYLSGIEVSGFAGMPNDFTVVSLPAAKYACFPIVTTFPSCMKPATLFPGGFRNPATNPPPQPTLKHPRSSNVIVKNSIRRPEWVAWRFGSHSKGELMSRCQTPIGCRRETCAIKCAISSRWRFEISICCFA